MAQIKVLDLDSVCLSSDLAQKEAGAINGGYFATYYFYRRILGTSITTSRRAASAAYRQVIRDGGTVAQASTASLSTLA